MRLPKFFHLKKAINNLDINFIAKRIEALETHLINEGQELEPDCTAVTEEGIFYISADSGMATKVALYLVDQQGGDVDPNSIALAQQSGSQKPLITNTLHEYHILRCNTLRNAEAQGWKGNYRIAQRKDGTFSCRVVEHVKKRRKIKEEVREVNNHKLYICPNCFLKVNSLLEGVNVMKRELFDLKYFFDVDFTRSWCRHEKISKEHRSLDSIYPRDWLEISKIRKAQVNYHCESCETDLSHPRLRKYLYVHHTDHVKRKVGFVRLECLCIGCLAELPAHSKLKHLDDYREYTKNDFNIMDH